MRIAVNVDKNVESATKLLAGIPGGIERALKNALPRTASHLRSVSGKHIRERYAISQSAIRANENIKVRYSYQNGVTLMVEFNGSKIPLYRFDGASPKEPTVDTSKTVNVIVSGGYWKTVHPGVAAAGHILNGTAPTRFEDAFTARMKSGHTGIFERTDGASASGADAIREIMGLSVPQMLGHEDVSEKIAEAARIKFEERLEHEVTRILNGWGR